MDKTNIKLIKLFLSQLKIEYTDYYVTDFFNSNTPSFNTISKFLSKYDIDSITVNFTTEQLKEVDYPILFIIDEKLYIGEKYKDNEIHLITEKDKEIVTTKEEFELEWKWKGLAILVDASNPSSEPGFQKNRIKQSNRRLLNFVSIMSFFGIIWLISNHLISANIILLSFFLFNIVGAIISFHLVRLTNGEKTLLTDTVCSLSNSSCEKVLTSKAANIKGFSLADIGFTYFIFLSLLTAIAPIRESYYIIILAISGIASLFSIFSVGYQIKLKAWCPLCFIVVLILLIDFAFLIIQGFHQGNIIPYEILEVILLAFATITFWNYTKEGLSLKNRANKLRMSLNDFKSDEFIQDQIIENGREVSTVPQQSYLELGDQKSNHEIIVITSPLCKPCEKTHVELHSFIKSFKDSISIKLLPFISNSPSLANSISESFLGLSNSDKLEIINEWYSLKEKNMATYEKWKVNREFEKISQSSFSNEWLIENKINYTPCLIVNRRVLSDHFGLEQIKEYLKRH